MIPVEQTVLEWLRQKSQRLVIAESCTCGAIAARLGCLPGVSEYFCGSLVTYREASKQAWLGIDEELLHAFSAESPEASAAMAVHALVRTIEANFSAAVTGHFGPNAPAEKDGVIHIAIAQRNEQRVDVVHAETIRLKSSSRRQRQHEATNHVLLSLVEIWKCGS